MATAAQSNEALRRNRRTAIAAAAVFFVMLGAAFAAVPLYRLFCQATGFAGTTQVAHVAPTLKGRRTLTVRFDVNVGQGLPWSVEPETPSIDLRTGETATVYFKFRNQAGRPTAANAVYNVTPDVAGAYFDKIACFCFSEQRLGPAETAELPVVFFLDPKLEQDETMKDIGALTLSYTLYPARDAALPVAVAPNQNKDQRRL
ncbi:MAG TPA: cytochrome c oxidase assembly protein [Roseiarcus sp.]|nr:cytochrome c oxidase assembly protein [Roseiarcus sp.]